MGVNPTKITNLTLGGNNGEVISKPQTKEQQSLARAIAQLDQRGDLSRADLQKLSKMKPSAQIAYLNSALKNTGYKIAQVRDCEDGELYPGVTCNSMGVFINYSKGGKTIEYDGQPGIGHFSIEYKK